MKRLTTYLLCLAAVLPIAATTPGDDEELDALRRQLDAQQAAIDSLTALHVADSLRADSLMTQLATDSIATTLLQDELQRLEAYRQESIDARLQERCPDLRQPFSAQSLPQLCAYNTLLEFFEGDALADSLRQDVERAIRYKADYDTLAALLRQPFKREAIIRADRHIMQELRPLAGNELTQEQFDELDSIDVYLTRYKQGVLDFQKLIADVETQLRSYQGNTDADSRDFCIAKYRQILATRQDDIDKRISHIPYLSERFAIYDTNMQRNPLQLDNATRRAIADINSMNVN